MVVRAVSKIAGPPMNRLPYILTVLVAVLLMAADDKGEKHKWKIEELTPLLAQVERGSPSRGQAIFRVAGCATCHTLDSHEAPANLAPDLTDFGKRHSADDLLDSIVNPSRVIANGYLLSEIVNVNNTIMEGRVIKRVGNTIHVQTYSSDKKVLQIPAVQVDSIRKLRRSPMPIDGLDGLGKEQIVDLLAYVMKGEPNTPMHRRYYRIWKQKRCRLRQRRCEG